MQEGTDAVLLHGGGMHAEGRETCAGRSLPTLHRQVVGFALFYLFLGGGFLAAETLLPLILLFQILQLGSRIKILLLEFDELGIVDGGHHLAFVYRLTWHDENGVNPSAHSERERGVLLRLNHHQSVEGGTVFHVGGTADSIYLDGR